MAYNYEYPYTDPNRYNSDWILNTIKKLSEEWIQVNADWNGLRSYVESFFADLDIQEEVDNRIDELIQSGYFDSIIKKYDAVVSTTPVSIYVSAVSGNDNNDGTVQKPIQSAEKLNAMLCNIVKGELIVYLDNSGTYSDIRFVNVHANTILVIGTDTTFTELATGFVNVSGIDFNSCGRCYVKHLHVEKNENYVSFIRNTFVLFEKCYFQNSAPNSCIGATENSIIMLESCTLTGKVGVSANYLTKTFAHACTIYSEIGFWPKYGSQSSHSNCVFSPSTTHWVFTESGSIQLSEIGNITHVTQLGNLEDGVVITADGSNISTINKIKLTLFDSSGMLCVGTVTYNQRSRQYEQACVGKAGSSYNLGFFWGNAGNIISVSATEISVNSFKLSVSGGTFEGVRYMVEIC